MDGSIKYTDKEIQALMDGIQDGSIDEYDLPEELYLRIAEALRTGLYKGFGGTLADFEGKDLELLTELRENIYMFSAAKTYQEVKEIGSLMFDENGERVSVSDFNKAGRAAFDTWNNDYGRTEYNTAEASATMAVKWNEIEANKDLLPTLQYSTIGDACEICAPLDGMTAPVESSVWSNVYPPNHFNCRCVVEQIEDVVGKDSGKDIAAGPLGKMDDDFKMNSGKDKYIFKDDHPYFQVASGDEKWAKNNFGLSIPAKD
jgi:hypothetical protein